MSTIVLDAELRAKLNGGNEPVVFTDEAGNVVGRYMPGDMRTRLAAVLFPPLTREEIAEARREMLEHGGVSTEDMLAVIQDAKRAGGGPVSYRVVWRKRLRDSLKVFLFLADHDKNDTDEMELAFAEINSRLARDPANEGESRADPERAFIVHPLSVKYEVFEEGGRPHLRNDSVPPDARLTP